MSVELKGEWGLREVGYVEETNACRQSEHSLPKLAEYFGPPTEDDHTLLPYFRRVCRHTIQIQYITARILRILYA